MRILLIRHGETEWNRIRRFQGQSDIPLNQTGREQARALGRALKDESIDVFYASPLTRAIETAQSIQAHHPSARIIEEKGFLEMDLGEFDGLNAKDWVANYPEFREKWMKNPSKVKMPGGESLRHVQVRAVKSLNNVVVQHNSESTLAIVTHNFVICSILCHALEISLDRFREIKQDTAALNILEIHGEKLQVDRVNDTTHLRRIASQ